MSRPGVFISYSHADEAWKDRLVRHLRVLELENELTVWDDRRIAAGDDWLAEIEQALASAGVAVLLISADFLGSDFIRRQEVPRILRRRAAEEVRVVPLIVEPCPWQAVGWLAALQMRPRDARPLAAGEKHQAEAELAMVALEIREHLRQRAPAPPRPEKEPPPAEAATGTDWNGYFEALIAQTDHITVRGLAAPSGGRETRHPIEWLYTPLSSRGLEALETGSFDLVDRLPLYERLLLLGPSGCGKTTFLRFVACMLARDAAGRRSPDGGSWRSRYLGQKDQTPPRTPVLLRLADAVPLLEDGAADRHGLLDWLERRSAISRQAWEELLVQGSTVLLLDGLDELVDPRLRGRFVSVLGDVCRHWPSPIVITSRPIETGELVRMGFRAPAIEPFGDREIRLFVDRWVKALRGAGGFAERAEPEEGYRRKLLAALFERPRVRRLAANPEMLTALCVVHWNEGELSEGRSRVYDAVIRRLLAGRSDRRTKEGFTDELACRALARLAFETMQGPGKRSLPGRDEAAAAVEPVARRLFPDLDRDERHRRVRDWLRFECLGSELIEETAGRVRFLHPPFQEYLAALELAGRGDGYLAGKDWWPTVKARFEDAQWRETVAFFAECLLSEGERGRTRLDKLLDRVLALGSSKPELTEGAWVVGIVGRLLKTVEAYDYRPQPEVLAAYREACDRLLRIFTVDGAARVPVAERIAAAEVLGRGGDPRFASLDEVLIEVPGRRGESLGKYPVTVEEYQAFVGQRGYEESKYWSAEGWAARQKGMWDEPQSWGEQLATPNRCAVGVSWYEAQAYCSWLSEQTGQRIALPSEKTWERAATPENGRYPWGTAEPDEERANFASRWCRPNVGFPTPVGVYPAGNGRWGHCDLAGNVWEWCEESWPESQGVKVLRGGSWSDSRLNLRSTSRRWFSADNRGHLAGFRLAAAPAQLDA